MKALTLTQPWATLVAIGAKRVETRSWRTEFRGQIAIHAAKGFPDDARYTVTVEPFQSVLRAAMGRDIVTGAHLPTACIIALADLVEVRRFDEASRDRVRSRSARGDLPQYEADFGDYGLGRFGFVLENVVKLARPVPARGMLNLWNVPTPIENEVRRQLAA